MVSAFFTVNPVTQQSQMCRKGALALNWEGHMWSVVVFSKVAWHFQHTFLVVLMVRRCTPLRWRWKFALMSLQLLPVNSCWHPPTVHVCVVYGGCLTVSLVPSSVIHWLVRVFINGSGLVPLLVIRPDGPGSCAMPRSVLVLKRKRIERKERD